MISPARIRQGVLAATIALAMGASAQETAYEEGQAAIRAQQWEQAARAFERAEREGEQSQRAAALYWQAYARHKERKIREAERLVRQLERRYPDSPWVDDARALTVTGDNVSAENGLVDEELRLYALSRLMERDPDRALPLVMDLLQKTDSDRTRRDALFVLGVSDEPAAQRAIATIARDAQNPDLQIQAVQALGVSDSDEAMDLLGELYSSSSDPSVRRAVVHAGISADAKELLVRIVREEKDPQVQNEAITALGAIDATDALRELYPVIQDPSSRRAVLNAMGIADDTEALRDVLATETNPELRFHAIQSIGISGGAGSADILRDIYANPVGERDRLAVLDTMVMIDEDARDLAMTIAENETDPALQAKAIQVLGLIDATEALQALYVRSDDRNVRMAVLQSFMVADESDLLLDILQQETDPELRAQAIQSIAVNEADGASAVFVDLYGRAESREREAILNAMMIMDDARGLIDLMRQETDRERKKRILQVLAMIDSEEATEYLFEMMEAER
ncbi:MAG: HEAT repeat domain-containing protein [Xanthomonadales bacterium]|nr:HEAT repeat domain-containing protein [Xanthomonadales bacterium]